MKTFTFEHNHHKIVLELHYKFCILEGDSGTGKTSIAIDIRDNWIYHNGKQKVFSLIDESALVVIPDGVEIVFVDESYIRLLRGMRKLVEFLKQPYIFVLITRDAIKELNYSPKQIYRVNCVNNVYHLEQKFSDYSYLSDSPDYIEDSKSGYLYFKQFYPNIKSTFGKDCILREAEEGSTLVADGCSFGSVINDTYSRYNLFLPESFEWMLLRKKDLVPDVTMSWNAESDYFKACKLLPYPYSKSKLIPSYSCRDYLKDFEIPDSTLCDYINKYKCNVTLTELRKLIYDITGDYSTDEVIKIAIVLHTLNKH